MSNVIIYVLCHNTERLNSDKYNKYSWAKPILLTTQDYSQENSFWKHQFTYLHGTPVDIFLKTINKSCTQIIMPWSLCVFNTKYT